MGIKKTSSKTAKKREQTPLSRVLASSKSRAKVQGALFEKLDTKELRNSVKQLANHRHFKDAIQLNNKGLSYKYAQLTPEAPLRKNVAWCLGVVEFHAIQLQFFLDHQKSIELALLLDDIDSALENLDQIDTHCGVSLWSIGLRSAIFSHSGRHEERQKFLLDISTRARGNQFFKSISFLISNKYEEGGVLSPESSFSEQNIRRSYSGQILHFLMYKLSPMNMEFEYDFEKILNLEKNTSPIDILCCLIDIIFYSLASTAANSYLPVTPYIAKALSRQLSSPLIYALGNFHDAESGWKFDEIDNKILNLYTKGEYRSLVEEMKDRRALEKFTNFHMFAKAACRTPTDQPGFLGALLKATSSMLIKNEDFDKSTQIISLLSHSFSMLPWFRELQLLLLRETNFYSTEANKKLEEASLIVSEVNSPRKAAHYKGYTKTNYISQMLESLGNSPVCKLFGITPIGDTEETLGLLDDVDPLRAKKYLAIKKIEMGQPSQAIDVLRELTSSHATLIANEAVRVLIPAYIMTGNPLTAVEEFVATALRNPTLAKVCDSNAICSVCESLINTSESIAIPVALSIHAQLVNQNHIATLKYSFERFLFNNGVESPLELFDTEIANNPFFNYFMEHVCTPEIMNLYLYFDTVKDIETCRIEICKKLVERNHSADLMIFEIKERTRRLVIHDATKHVENSRIYSDTTSFSTSKDLQKLYERFSELRQADYSKTNDEEALLSFINALKGQDDVIHSAHLIHVQDIVLNEKNALFLKLLKLMRDEFTFGPKGLSGYLSTRIKHGYFPTAIRKCAADEGLISPKTSVSGGYKKNTLWIDKFEFLPATAQSEADKAFAEFSTRFDESINKANDTWLKITIVDQDMAGLRLDKDAEEALLNYSTTYLESYILQLSLPPEATYSHFSKLATEWLWNRTERNLEQVRHKISTELRDTASRQLNKLESEILNIVKDEKRTEFFSDTISRARAKLTTSIDTVLGWFTRSQGTAIAQFDSGIAMEIARLSAGTEINYSDSSSIQFQGRALSYLVDVLYVLLENCVTKSNLPKDLLTINGSLVRHNDSIELTIENNCNPVEDIRKENDNLSFYRNTYGKESFMIQASQSQGGTGLFKIWKALSKDLDLPHKIDFGYSTESSFKVTLLINEISKVIQK